MTTLPECCARICSSRYSFGVSVTRWSLMNTARAAKSIDSGPNLTTGSPREARNCRRIAECARARQLRHAERLDDIIVGAELEKPHLLGFIGAHRKHDQRHRGPGPQPFEHVGAVHVGQAEIEDDEVGGLQRRRTQRLGAGLGLLDGKAVELEAGAQKPPDLHFVVDHKHAGRNLIHQR